MSAGKSIVAKFGLDNKTLRKDLVDAQTMVKNSAYQMSSDMKRAIKRGTENSGSGHGGVSGARMFGDPLNAITGTTGNVSKIGMLSHLTGSAGAATGIVAVAGTITEIVKAIIRLEESTQEANKLMGKGTQRWQDKFLPTSLQEGMQAGDPNMTGLGGLRERSGALKDKSESMLKEWSSPGFWTSLGAMAAPSLVNPVVERFNKAQRDIEDERLKIDKQIAEWVNKEAAARETLVHKSERQGQHAQVQLEVEKKIADAKDRQKKHEINPAESRAIQKAALEEGGQKDQAIDVKFDSEARSIELQKKLNELRVIGDDAGVESARARVHAANDEVEAASKLTKEDQDRAGAKLIAAQTDLTLAERARDVLHARQATEKDIANSEEAVDQKHLDALRRERADLEKAKKAEPNKDRKNELDVSLAKNAEAIRAAQNTIEMRPFDVRNSKISAGQGVGQGEAQRATLEQIANESKRLEKMKSKPEFNSPDAIANQAAKVAQMKRAYDDVAHSIAVGNTAAAAHTVAMNKELGHQTTIAHAVAEQLEYQRQIDEAQRNKNDKLADELKQQKEIAALTAAQRADEARQEKNGLSLSQLASMHGANAAAARRIERIENRADRARARGNVGRSNELRADANRRRVRLEERGILKPSEANKDLAANMDKSEVLKQIRDNTAQPPVNR